MRIDEDSTDLRAMLGDFMSDQADGLRQLVQARSGGGTTALAEPPPPVEPRTIGRPTRTRSLVLTSGKGGVGTSNLALNLAIALGELGQRVVLVDADLGLANIDLLCGLAPASDLGDVLAGGRPLAEMGSRRAGEFSAVSPSCASIETQRAVTSSVGGSSNAP